MNAPHELNGAASVPPVPVFDINLIPAPDGSIGPLFADLAAAQGEFEPIEKNQTARIVKNGQLLYTFDYADMGEITKKTTPALSKHGIAVVSLPTMRDVSKGGHVLRTMLCHKSGARIESVLVIPDMRGDGQKDKDSTVKDFGGYITYLRRYQVSAMLNVSADADLDGSHTDDEGHGSDAPRIGAPAPSQAPFNPSEHPELAKATNLHTLNKAWLAIKEDKRAKFQAHYDARLEALTPPEPPRKPAEAF